MPMSKKPHSTLSASTAKSDPKAHAEALVLSVRKLLQAISVMNEKEFKALKSTIDAFLTSNDLSASQSILLSSVEAVYKECRSDLDIKLLDEELRNYRKKLLASNLPIEPEAAVIQGGKGPSSRPKG